MAFLTQSALPSVIPSNDVIDTGLGAGVNPLAIGSVTFASIETPSDLPLGSVEQRTVVKELIGGGRVVQTLGIQPKRVSWRGHLFGGAVSARIQSLRAFVTQGNEQLVSWMGERYYCIVQSFTPHYHHANYAEYEIDLEITRDANGVLTGATPTGVDGQISQTLIDLANQNAAILKVDVPGSAGINTQVLNVQQALTTAGPVAQLSGPSLTSLLSTISTAISTVTTYTAGLSATAPQYSNAVQMQNLLTIILANVQRGQAPQSARIQGGDLFAQAALKYGDISQAFALANANGFAHPVLPSNLVQTIVYPPFQKS